MYEYIVSETISPDKTKEIITRCKNCKYAANGKDHIMCKLFSDDFRHALNRVWIVEPNDFCKWGEGKDK